MGDATEEPQPMKVEEPDSRNSEKIDMSLDEIIKRNKEEQKANKAAQAKNKRLKNRNNVLKKLDKAGQQPGRYFRRGAYPFQGPYRSWFMGSTYRGFYRRRGFGVSRGAFRGTGVSPLDRPSLDAEATGKFGQTKNPFRGRYRGRGQASGRGGDAAQFQTKANWRGGRPFVLNRAFPRGGRGGGKLERFQKVRGWRRAPSSGSLLTVSLDNPKAADAQGRANPGSSSDRLSQTAGPAYSNAKGIPLRFNFKATINQTTVTLNDRFTSLKIRGQRSWRDDVRGRGRGRGRGLGRGRGRGRGRGQERGRGGAFSRGGGFGRGGVRGGRGRGGAFSRGRGFGRGGVGGRGGRGGRINRGGGRGRGTEVRDNRTVTLQ